MRSCSDQRGIFLAFRERDVADPVVDPQGIFPNINGLSVIFVGQHSSGPDGDRPESLPVGRRSKKYPEPRHSIYP